MSSSENQRIAEEIMSMVDEKQVIALNHCSTRLRFRLPEDYQLDERIKDIKGVLGVVKSMDGYQVIVGNNVSDVYKEIMNKYSFKGEKVADDVDAGDVAETSEKKGFSPKKKDNKELAASCAITAALAGVTEPTLYGISIKYRKPLIATFIGCAANGIYCAITQL
jgi:phosphotransferase system IIB component